MMQPLKNGSGPASGSGFINAGIVSFAALPAAADADDEDADGAGATWGADGTTGNFNSSAHPETRDKQNK